MTASHSEIKGKVTIHEKDRIIFIQRTGQMEGVNIEARLQLVKKLTQLEKDKGNDLVTAFSQNLSLVK